jgi:hypothetical protein
MNKLLTVIGVVVLAPIAAALVAAMTLALVVG